jgi:hypothetical protein
MGEKSEAARLPNMGYPEVIRPVEKKATHGTWIDKQAMPRKYKLSYSRRSIPSTPRIRNNMRTVSSSLSCLLSRNACQQHGQSFRYRGMGEDGVAQRGIRQFS